jgi:hypothetical protein
MPNRFDGICYKCGQLTPKGKGFAEKTNQSHRAAGIRDNWVTRCRKCKGEQFTPNHTHSKLKPIFRGLSNYSYSIWFDKDGHGHMTVTYRQHKLKTIISSHSPSKDEIAEKNHSLTIQINKIQAYIRKTQNN